MPSSPACSPTAERSASAVVRYDIEDRFTLRFAGAASQTAAELLDVWCPSTDASCACKSGRVQVR